MHLGGRIVDGDAAGFFLFLLFWIVGGEVGRDALPGLAMIARAEQELCPNVDCAFLVRAHVNRGVPVEAKFFLAIIGQRLDSPPFVRVAIHAADFSALRFGVDVVGIGRVFEHPEAVAAIHVFPARVGDAAGIGRISHPGAVVLQAAIDVIGVGIVKADVIELRHRQVHEVLPAVAAVFAAPQAAVVAGNHDIWILGIDPNVMKVAVHRGGNIVEGLSAIVA